MAKEKLPIWMNCEQEAGEEERQNCGMDDDFRFGGRHYYGEDSGNGDYWAKDFGVARLCVLEIRAG